MMIQMNPYLNFSGKCREALAFYQECFGGEILALQSFGDANSNMPEEFKDNVMHAEFKAEGIYLMASDGRPGAEPLAGGNVTLSLHFVDVAAQEKIFAALAQGGKVTLPLEDSFWGARFGLVTDRFGMDWMLNCPLK